MAKKNKKKSKSLKRRDLEKMMAANGSAFGNGMAANNQQGIFASLSRILPQGRNEQFLLGLVIGGAAAYVLSDEELRGKLFKGALKLYGGIAGGMAEMKEQLSDVQAEIQAEQNGLI